MWVRAGTQRARVLVTVKGYPQLSHRSGEVVCVAGVRLDLAEPQWIRLFPVPFRDLPTAGRFKKYDVIEVTVRRGSDSRPESYVPDFTDAEVVHHVGSGPDQLWLERRGMLGPLLGGTSACALYRANQGGGPAPSLGLIKPAEILDVVVEPNRDFDADKRRLAELAAEETLLAPAKEQLQPAPWTVRYRYRCSDPTCGGHSQSLIDWELGEAGRRWASRYPPRELPDRIRTKFYNQLCGGDRDPYFFLGNQKLHLQSFLVLGVFWPRRRRPGESEQLELPV